MRGRGSFHWHAGIMAILVSVLLLIMIGMVRTDPVYRAPVTNGPSSGSWNPLVNCAPDVLTIEQILGNQTNALGGASETGSVFDPGVNSSYGPASWLTASSMTPLGWVSPGPSCTITNSQGQIISTFVQIDGVQRDYRVDQNWNAVFQPINGGSAYATGRQSDTTFNIFAPGTGTCDFTNTTGCMHILSVVMDQDWKAAGYCGPNTACDNNTLVGETAAYKSLIDVQGFISWNPSGTNSSGHDFSGWELHSLTAWRLSNTSSDYTLSAGTNPLAVVVGQSASTKISVNTFNLFTGNVSFTATETASASSSGAAPTIALAPTSVFIAPGATAATALTVKAGSSTTGNYTVVVSSSNGIISRIVNVSVYVTDFAVTANPASLSIALGSTGQSTISLSSSNGFAGNVSLSTQVSPASTTAGLSPNNPTVSLSSSSVALSPGSTGSATLTVSTSLLTVPGTYTVTVTAASSGVSHTMTVTVTVTVAGLGIVGLI